MKKIKYILIAIIAFVVPIIVLAKTNIEGTEIVDIKIPENWTLYTKSNVDEMMTLLGFDNTKKINYKYTWKTDSYYFEILNEEKNLELILMKKISDSKFDDLSIYQDEKINNTFKELKKEYTIKPKISLYKTNKGIKYYKVEYVDEENSLYYIEYITTIHGNMYKYKIQSSVDLSSDLRKNVEDIIDTIEYNKYLKFVKRNEITDEPKKDNSGLIIAIVLILVLGGGIGIYIFLNKKKNNIKNKTAVQVQTPVQSNISNPAVADFMNPTNSNMIEQKNIDLGQSNINNQK